MKQTPNVKRTQVALTAAVVALAAVAASLAGVLVVAARDANGFMITFTGCAMALILVVEGVFLGKLISLRKVPR